MSSLVTRSLFEFIKLESGGDSVWHRPGGWVCESLIFKSDYAARPSGSDWFADTELLIPLLVVGVIESRTSTAGMIFYRPVESAELPKLDVVEFELGDESLMEIYDDTMSAAMQLRERIEVGGGLCIPLSATR